LDSTTSTPDIAASPTLLVRVGDGVYGCDIAEAQEIIPLRPMTRLPGAPPFVRGLINMRGTIVTVLDLGQRLDPARAPIENGSIVLVRHRERLVGLVVDEVADVRVLNVNGSDAAQAASAGGAIVRGVAVGNAKSGDADVLDAAASDEGEHESGAVVVLDLDALIKQVLLS
jgi:chemotaxis signal transduction protein